MLSFIHADFREREIRWAVDESPELHQTVVDCLVNEPHGGGIVGRVGRFEHAGGQSKFALQDRDVGLAALTLLVSAESSDERDSPSAFKKIPYERLSVSAADPPAEIS